MTCSTRTCSTWKALRCSAPLHPTPHRGWWWSRSSALPAPPCSAPLKFWWSNNPKPFARHTFENHLVASATDSNKPRAFITTDRNASFEACNDRLDDLGPGIHAGGRA